MMKSYLGCCARPSTAASSNIMTTIEKDSWRLAIMSSSFRFHLVLLDFAAGQFADPQVQSAVFVFHLVTAISHSSTLVPIRLHKLPRRSERPETGGKIAQCLFGEITVRVIGEKCTINLPVLQFLVYLTRLTLLFLLSCLIGGKEKLGDLACNVRGCICRILIGENDDSHAIIRKNHV